MVKEIVAINIIFENGDNVILDSKDLKDFCISNLDKDGNEIPYTPTVIKNKLYANFMLLNINNKNVESYKLNRLKERQDIVEVMIIFNNQKFINFTVCSNANPFTTVYNNDYEHIYENEDSLGLLLSKYNIKYQENLFI